jgi:hypothetical protein
VVDVIGPSLCLSGPGAFEHNTTINREEDVVPLPVVALSQGNGAFRVGQRVGSSGSIDDVIFRRVISLPHGTRGRAWCLEGIIILLALLIVSVDERFISLFHDSEG